VLPGGWCPDYLRRDKRFVDLVRNMVTASKLTLHLLQLAISAYSFVFSIFICDASC